MVAGPGTFVLVPPNVTHTFSSPDATRFLSFHTPGMGFDRHLLGTLDVTFDQHAPEGDEADPASVVVRTAETEAIRVADAHIGILASADETLGAIGAVEYVAPPSFAGPPAHLHEHTWDVYHVLEGCLAMRIGDDRLELAPGELAVVPPGTVHGFANATDAPTRFLDVHAPGGFESYFREIAAELGDGSRDPAALAEIASRYDMVAA